MKDWAGIVGIDIGSVGVSVVELSPQGEVRKTGYACHLGNPKDTLRRLLNDIPLERGYAVAATSGTPKWVAAHRRTDHQVAVIRACKDRYLGLAAILIVGGEKFGLIRFEPDGTYRDFRTNSSCAAGTGSFLDQQAQRLKLRDTAELSELALRNRGPVPGIASRCAVFAKTDLIHAQSEGYALSEICDGLCAGLAKNIIDTLFSGIQAPQPLVFVGGVSRNASVVAHIERSLGISMIVDPEHVHGATGAALDACDAHDTCGLVTGIDDVIRTDKIEKSYFFPPLRLERSDYPEFTSWRTFEDRGPEEDWVQPVEVDIYQSMPHGADLDGYLGIDIGSTSTKAALTTPEGEPLVGLYTRTSGRPVEAVQRLFSCLDRLAQAHDLHLDFRGVGTTGSGRKLIGRIIDADLVIDEISAHARAAVALNPKVDTIIEIGGQDSKFTTLKDSLVTFCVMNHVCAAGTGSFIEEQAQRLGCALGEIEARTRGCRAPLASDRCTVFMERDINYLLDVGFCVDEVLTTVLHSVCENYLRKVAVEHLIGETVFFQGATAKNRGLVAAFEQRLGRPILVSQLCHLTGALGTARCMSDERRTHSRFRGLDLYRMDIPIRAETCNLCTNHCKLTVANVGGEEVGYGFLCGRDYQTERFVNNNRSGFDLFRARRKAQALPRKGEAHADFTISIPNALHLTEDIAFWTTFFNQLGVKVFTSKPSSELSRNGKMIAGAEFCAPMATFFGHVADLLARHSQDEEKPNFVFAPFYFENKTGDRNDRRQYCYYTQFAPALVGFLDDRAIDGRSRVLTPLIKYLYHDFHTKTQLYRMLRSISSRHIPFLEVSAALDAAREFQKKCAENLHEAYRGNVSGGGFHVVLLGRPYTVLSPAMNKRIPDIFSTQGIKVFFQDMVPRSTIGDPSLKGLLDEFHWNFAKEILETAATVAAKPGAYPVLLTSFKCSPDAFVMDYFKQLMESHGKPYLILQLDDHDSSAGYETRIEAAVRAFENHFRRQKTVVDPHYPAELMPHYAPELTGKTVLIPNWDETTMRLVVAVLQRAGLDARLLVETDESIRKSLRTNTGQCIPLNIIAQEAADYVERNALNPKDTVLWSVFSRIACNIRMFPHHLRTLMRTYGGGMEHVEVYMGNISFGDVSFRLPVNMYFAHMFGGFLRKMGCAIRPNECRTGDTDAAIERGIALFESAFSGEISKESAVDRVVREFEAIATQPTERRKVAVFGDFYVRDNRILNQDLIRFIERHGGEVVTTPYSTLGKMIAGPYMRKWLIEGNVFGALSTKALIATVSRLEKTYLRSFERILGPQTEAYNDAAEDILQAFGVRIEHTGESMENLLKIHYIRKYHPDVSLFVQVSPAFCCPSLVTEGMSKIIEERTGVPIVSITYDGTGGNKNDAIIPYLVFDRKISPRNPEPGRVENVESEHHSLWRFGRRGHQSHHLERSVVAQTGD